MAKSTRSKVKRSFRAKKREEGVYAANEAARLQRLSTKLAAIRDIESPEVDAEGGKGGEGEEGDLAPTQTDKMELETGSTEPAPSTPAKVSTHGPRGSRREEWRASKGMTPRVNTSDRVNRQGVVVAKRKSGRPKRRR